MNNDIDQAAGMPRLISAFVVCSQEYRFCVDQGKKYLICYEQHHPYMIYIVALLLGTLFPTKPQ